MKLKTILLSASLCATATMMTTSCDDMLDKGNDYVIYADDHLLNTPADTMNNLVGILHKLQSIAVRTNLLGEVRADLVKVEENAKEDLKDMAEFKITDENEYNNPRDYFSVINSCNIYLAKADSTAGNINRNEKYFQNEIAQVHSIRAWVYLQMAMVYNRVPLVVDPILTKQDAEKSYPMVDLQGVCDYFINDLARYVGTDFPDPRNFGTGINPKYSFLPSQLVMGDLYLWRATLNHSVEDAKSAAKKYYDYLVWDRSGKNPTTTSTSRAYWSVAALSNPTFELYTPGTVSFVDYQGTEWGRTGNQTISIILMDSLASDKSYNELRQLYCSSYEQGEIKESCISASEQLKALSKAQTYLDLDNKDDQTIVLENGFSQSQLADNMFGDLRLYSAYYTTEVEIDNDTKRLQSVRKHNYQHVSVYRTSQIYLRLAEALNYAGYPRFARQILTTGVDNDIIDRVVLPFYPSKADTAFISYFNFSTANFHSMVADYTPDYLTSSDVITDPTTGTDYNVPAGFVLRGYKPSRNVNNYNMVGIHSRGSGLAYFNDDYCVLSLDSAKFKFPYNELSKIGAQPIPPVVEPFKEPTFPGDRYQNNAVKYAIAQGYDELYVLPMDEWKKAQSKTSQADYDKYVEFIEGTYTTFCTVTRPNAKAEYDAKCEELLADYVVAKDAYEVNTEAFKDAYKKWNEEVYLDPALIEHEQKIVDQAILDEQALELAFEGNRFYDLMRRAFWYNDDTKLTGPVSKRTTSVPATKAGWFLKWNGLVGQ